MEKLYVYTLSDPLTNEVKYIGQTNNLKKRFTSHMNDRTISYKSNWIKSLKLKNLCPVIEILEECSKDDVDFLEIYWIEQFKNWGFKLTNLSSGGKSGYTLDPVSKNKISNNRLGHKQSYDTIQKRVRHLYKPILQYDLGGNFIREWDSIKDASEYYNISEEPIRKATIKTNSVSVGFLWKRKTENFPSTIKKVQPSNREHQFKPIYVYDLNCNFIEKIKSVKECALKYKVDESNICTSLKKEVTLKRLKNKRCNFIFKRCYEPNDIIKLRNYLINN